MKQVSPLSKIKIMNNYLLAYKGKISGKEIRRIVKEVFNIDLGKISDMGEGPQPLLFPDFIKVGIASDWQMQKDSLEFIDRLIATSKNAALDNFFHSGEAGTSPGEIYKAVEGIYGVNLQGISSLEYARLSLFSKGQWILRSDNDLLVFSTSKGDVDTTISPTPYYIEKTGSDQIPEDLQQDLKKLGFTYNPKMNAYYHYDPKGDSPKDQIMGAVIKALRQISNL